MQDLQKSGISLKNAINEVYQVKNGDKVSICVVSSNEDSTLESDLKDAFSLEGNSVTVLSHNDENVLASLKEYAKNESSDIDVAVCAYLEKYRA